MHSADGGLREVVDSAARSGNRREAVGHHRALAVSLNTAGAHVGEVVNGTPVVTQLVRNSLHSPQATPSRIENR